MKRIIWQVHCLAVVAVFSAAASQADAEFLISSDAANVGNGNLLSDPNGVNAPAGVFVGGQGGAPNTNANGRILAANGGTFGIGDATDLSQITDNPGVDIDGFTNYRVQYMSGNNAYGFIEEGAGFAGGTNTPNDGAAFANSSEYFLLSDDIPVVDGLAGDKFNISADFFFNQSFSNAFDDTNGVRTYLYFDNGAGTLVGDILPASEMGIGTLTDIAAQADYSSVRVGFWVDGLPNVNTVIDNINLERVPVPEPGSAVIALLGLAAAVSMGMRRRLG